MKYKMVAVSWYPDDEQLVEGSSEDQPHFKNPNDDKIWGGDGAMPNFASTEELVKFMLSNFKIDDDRIYEIWEIDKCDEVSFDGHDYIIEFTDAISQELIVYQNI